MMVSASPCDGIAEWYCSGKTSGRLVVFSVSPLGSPMSSALIESSTPRSLKMASSVPRLGWHFTAVPEIQFADFFWPAYEQVVNELSKYRYRSGGEYSAGMVIRTPVGGGIKGGHYHSQHPEAQFVCIPGLKVVCPSSAYDAKGLLLAAIADPDPVIFFEPKRIYRAAKGEVPEGEYTVPLGRAQVVRPGRDVTVLVYGAMLYEALDAAAKAQRQGVECEIVDLRTIWPVDIETIVESVKKTGRVVVVHEASRTGGFGAELVTLITEKAFYHLEAPPVRVTGFDTPFPYTLESEYMPLSHRILPALLDSARAS
jgi:pyruvate dehydrogenase E1 component beta subunit